MDLTQIVNCCFGWFLVILALIGYYLTYRKRGEKWIFWNLLAAGWAFFALSQTLLIAGAEAGTFYMMAIWLCSYIFVTAAMILLFVKLANLQTKQQ